MDRLDSIEILSRRITRACLALLAFLAVAVTAFLLLRQDEGMGGTWLSQSVFTLGSAALLGVLGSMWLMSLSRRQRVRRPVWFCPLLAAGLSLCLLSLGYIYIGVWPFGNLSVLIVDMYHQYAPFLSEQRWMLLHGGNFFYSFHLGLGGSFLPAYAYYLASPFNGLLLLFPERLLAEGILVITLLKNAAAAAAFAACAQYLYRRRNAATIAVAVMYSMMLYMLAYSWNIMWLDVVIGLPVVVLCLEHMLRRGKWLPYTLALALTLFANYYIGFMLCLFLVLYFFVWLLRRRRSLRACAVGAGRFAGGSLLAGGLTAALLIPTALALRTTSAAGGSLPEFSSNFPLFDLIGRLFFGASPTIRSGNLPNLYCGVLAVVLAPVYLTQRSLPLRRRLCYGVLTLLLLLSCTVNQWDLLWHGLHTPNDLPYRFSFLACFALLLLAARVLSRLERVTPAQIGGSAAACAVYLMLWEKWGGDKAPAPWMLYVNLLLVAVYAGVLLWNARGRLSVRSGRLLLLVVVTVELLLGSGDTLTRLNKSELYATHDSYVDNATAEATNAVLRRAEELAAAKGDLFCRTEYLPRTTCMDPMLLHYNGITTFASSNRYDTTVFMGQMGYAINGVNSYLYHGFVPVSDSLLGVRYVVLDFLLENHPQLALVDTVTVQDATRYIYENTLALPVGYFAHESVTDYYGTDNDPFLCQKRLLDGVMGFDTSLYASLPLEGLAENTSVVGGAFIKPQEEQVGIYRGTVETAGQYYGFVECRAAQSITLTTYTANGEMLNSWSISPSEPYVVDMGTLDSQVRVEISVEGTDVISGNMYVVRLDGEQLRERMMDLKASGLRLTKATATRIEGQITAPEDGKVLFSIPYDEGWRITVGGQEMPVQALNRSASNTGGALLMVEVPAGEHTIVLRYRTPGLVLGLGISGLSLAAVVLLLLWSRQRARRLAAKNAAKAVCPAEEDAVTENASEPSEIAAADEDAAADE